MKILFLVPHPDDLEFGASFSCIQALKCGYEVVEAVMTLGEYGVTRDEFKGKRIQQLRSAELDKASQVYLQHTHNALRIIRMGYFDGYVPFNQQALNKVEGLLQSEKPEIFFAPDPFFSVDLHSDHLNTGRLAYFAIKALEKGERPHKLVFYYTFKPNLRLQTSFEDLEILTEAVLQYKSQINPSKIQSLKRLKKLSMRYKALKSGAPYMNLRQIDAKTIERDATHNVSKLTDKIKHATISNLMVSLPGEDRYKPSPKELGL